MCKQAAACRVPRSTLRDRVQGTADMYGMEVEDIAKSHDSWKAQAMVLKAQLVLRDKEIDKLVPPPLPCDLCALLLWLNAH